MVSEYDNYLLCLTKFGYVWMAAVLIFLLHSKNRFCKKRTIPLKREGVMVALASQRKGEAGLENRGIFSNLSIQIVIIRALFLQGFLFQKSGESSGIENIKNNILCSVGAQVSTINRGLFCNIIVNLLLRS